MTEKFDYGVQINLNKPDDFLLIKETLTRIGIPSKKGKTLYQSCCIFHKRGLYYITHFKEMFAIGGRENQMCSDDYRRRNTVARLISEWGMCTIVDKSSIELMNPVSDLKIVPFREKKDWTLVSKFSVGGRK